MDLASPSVEASHIALYSWPRSVRNASTDLRTPNLRLDRIDQLPEIPEGEIAKVASQRSLCSLWQL